MKIAFTPKLALIPANKVKLARINSIIEEYRKMNYKLTLRQLYYQLVSRNVIPNNVKEYDKLSDLLTKGRMAGVVDWNAIEDRTRIPFLPYYNNDIADAISDAHDHYRLNRQEDQANYVELWVEKDALSNVLRRKTQYYHVHLAVNKGYSSTTAMYDAYCRLLEPLSEGKSAHILYLGDHDPSGLDMVRDIYDRLFRMLSNQPQAINGWVDELSDEERDELLDEFEQDDDCREGADVNIAKAYIKKNFEVRHIALTTAQVRQYNPPPNPAKMKDPRANDYVAQHGRTSWEVDALNPEVLHEIIDTNILSLIDKEKFESMLEREAVDKIQLAALPDIRDKFTRIKEILPANQEDLQEKMGDLFDPINLISDVVNIITE